jgi:hypothetical protein
MSEEKTTICAFCKWRIRCLVGSDYDKCGANMRLSYVTGVADPAFCSLKNDKGNCPDFQPKPKKKRKWFALAR